MDDAFRRGLLIQALAVPAGLAFGGLGPEISRGLAILYISAFAFTAAVRWRLPAPACVLASCASLGAPLLSANPLSRAVAAFYAVLLIARGMQVSVLTPLPVLHV